MLQLLLVELGVKVAGLEPEAVGLLSVGANAIHNAPHRDIAVGPGGYNERVEASGVLKLHNMLLVELLNAPVEARAPVRGLCPSLLRRRAHCVIGSNSLVAWSREIWRLPIEASCLASSSHGCGGIVKRTL